MKNSELITLMADRLDNGAYHAYLRELLDRIIPRTLAEAMGQTALWDKLNAFRNKLSALHEGSRSIPEATEVRGQKQAIATQVWALKVAVAYFSGPFVGEEQRAAAEQIASLINRMPRIMRFTGVAVIDKIADKTRALLRPEHLSAVETLGLKTHLEDLQNMLETYSTGLITLRNIKDDRKNYGNFTNTRLTHDALRVKMIELVYMATFIGTGSLYDEATQALNAINGTHTALNKGIKREQTERKTRKAAKAAGKTVRQLQAEAKAAKAVAKQAHAEARAKKQAAIEARKKERLEKKEARAAKKIEKD